MNSPNPVSGFALSDSAVAEPMRPFRPLFFMAALFAVLAAAIYTWSLHTSWLPPTPLTALQWHGHELLFGFGGALISGFMLTAAAHWTNLPTTTPWSLAVLCLFWLAARVATFLHAPLALDMALDLAWLAMLVAMVSRVILRKRSRNHYVIVALVGSYLALDIAFFSLALTHSPWTDRALVWTVDWITILMLVIGGRIIPYFSTVLPHVDPVYRYGRVVGIGAALALLLDIVDAPAALRAAWWIILALFALNRLEGWHGWRCAREPMLWSLHLGYLWLVIGMLLRGTGLLVGGSQMELSMLHAITIGALGTLSLAMMTRLAQGRSRTWIRANGLLVAAFILPSIAAVAQLVNVHASQLLAGAAWVLAYLVYLAVIGPLLIRGKALSV